jgi:hypothetical protein
MKKFFAIVTVLTAIALPMSSGEIAIAQNKKQSIVDSSKTDSLGYSQYLGNDNIWIKDIEVFNQRSKIVQWSIKQPFQSPEGNYYYALQANCVSGQISRTVLIVWIDGYSKVDRNLKLMDYADNSDQGKIRDYICSQFFN